MIATITDKEFAGIRQFIYEEAGIAFSPAKKGLVCGRLARRLEYFGFANFTQYLELLHDRSHDGEVQTAINLLTTNETFFFREGKHFDVLRRHAGTARDTKGPFRVWSAACSTGEEPYSIAMVLDNCIGDGKWEVLGTDISTNALARARRAHYPEERARQMPPAYLQQYCRRGTGNYEGTLLVNAALRERVRFAQLRLNANLPDIGMFDCIFLRNVMIYFDKATRCSVVARVLKQLKPGGVLCVGHSESLQQINEEVIQLAPSVYHKP
jgi:chemotaxis protein methyltransferase CheR